MATLTTQTTTRAGITATFAAAAGGGDRFVPDRFTYIEIKNAGGSPITATIVTPRTDAYANPVADNAVVVGATTGDVRIGPFPAEIYASTDGTGLADITYTGVTSVTVGVFSLTQS